VSDAGVIVTLSPRDYDAILFDLDGVLTRTASVHAAAWKKLFDAFLERRAAETGEPFVPFDIDADYRRYVAGTVDLVQRALTGIEVSGDVLRLNPRLPEEVQRLDMRIRYRGHSLDLRVTRDTLTVRGRDRDAGPIQLAVRGETCEFAGDGTRAFRLDGPTR
jgi:phosphoglycolate phosphatase-like HAD superfamily hydrolase